MSPELRHKSVLAYEVMNTLLPKRGERVLDATLGLGGHAESFLQAIGPDGELVAIDADAENLREASERLAASAKRCVFHHANFRDVAALGLGAFDVIFADLGISSP